MNKQFFIEQLTNELEELKKSGIEGIRPLTRILEELEEDPRFSWDVVILDNRNFRMVYLKESKTFQLETTYSNQVINKEFLDQALFLYAKGGVIASILSTLEFFFRKSE